MAGRPAGPGVTRAAPIIVSATFGTADFAWLDALRRAHFPPERNQLPAHLTLFHHLPPSIEDELDRRLRDFSRVAPPRAEAAGLISLGSGVAVRIVSRELAAMRALLADAFVGLLTPQDRAGWRAHVTIQNKVAPHVARGLRTALERDFRPRPVQIAGLAAWRYRDGPWEPIREYRFRR